MTQFSREFQGEAVSRGNVAVRGVSFHSGVTRNQTASNWHRVEAGFRLGSAVTWIATWDQRTMRAEHGVATGILDSSRIGTRIPPGAILVAKVTLDGDPATQMDGSSLYFHLGLVGGVGGPVRPLVAASRSPEVSALEQQINSGGLSEWASPVQLCDPTRMGVYSGSDTDANNHSVTSTSYASGLVSVTLTMPAWATRGYYHVTTSASVLASGGAGGIFLSVGVQDEAGAITNVSEHGMTTSTTLGWDLSTSYAGEATQTLVLVPRFKIETNNATVYRQTISAIVYWQ